MINKLKIIKSNILKIPLLCMHISQWNGSVWIFPHGSEYEYYLLLEWVRGLVLILFLFVILIEVSVKNPYL